MLPLARMLAFACVTTVAALQPTPASALMTTHHAQRTRGLVAQVGQRTLYPYDQDNQYGYDQQGQYGSDQQGQYGYDQQNQYGYDQQNQYDYDQQGQYGYDQSTQYYGQDQTGYAQQTTPAYVQAEFDFPNPAAGQLRFRTGDVIEVTQQGEPDGWWVGMLNGQVGDFPSNFCSAPYYAQQTQVDYGYSQRGQAPSARQSQQRDAQPATYQEYMAKRAQKDYNDNIYDPRSATQTQWMARAY
jgi:hypothetical protein